MGYTRNVSAVHKVIEYLKAILEDPTTAHEWRLSDWSTARKMAYQLREGMYAAGYHEGYAHFSRLRHSHRVLQRDNLVRVEPKFDHEAVEALQPLPSWARYVGSKRDTIACDTASSVVDILATSRGLSRESPWNDILFPNVKWSDFTRQQRRAVHETAVALGRRVLDLDTEGISFVRVAEDDLFLSVYYDPEEEE